jgi:Mg/Co/Ni transporter MgtE
VRRRWLLGLLVLQSTSSFVLDNYQELLRNHLVVTLFLTMLVGAGGNAGNQSAIKVIRGLVCSCTSLTQPAWCAALSGAYHLSISSMRCSRQHELRLLYMHRQQEG